MKASHVLTLFLACVAWLGAARAEAGSRVALVIGNSAYQNVPTLNNPVNDAQDIAKALTAAGFDVIERENATRGQMADAVREFADHVQGAELALFYYAGHGLQMEGENYLIPIDARLEKPADVRFSTINLSDIQQEMTGPGRANVIVLDACRNNPFADKLSTGGRSVGQRGLGRVEASGVGTLIVFSTQPNNVAFDGGGRNSPFAAALAKNIGAPNVEIRQMISRVRADVLAATDQKQVPWDNSSLVGDVYLTRVTQAADAPAPKPEPAAPAPEPKAVVETPRQVEETATGDAAECEKYAAQSKPFATPEEIKASRKARDWPRALPFCKAASEADPGSARMHYLLAGAYFTAKDYLNARREAQTAADGGDAGGQVLLGYMYQNGVGVVKNDFTALDYYQKAVAAGDGRAMVNLAALYSSGAGVPLDNQKALALYEKAIEAGNPFALGQTGRMYFSGAGVPRDLAAAEQYFLQASDLGDGYSMKFLAILYENGLVGPADPAKAAQYRMRAEAEDPNSITPQVTFAKPRVNYTQHVRTQRRISYYRWGGGSYNPAWQAAPGDTRCCPNNMLVCPTPRHFC